MTVEPKISICLPVYNGASFLALAIESVLRQSWQNFELIIIDDCSQDNSLELIKLYAERDNRIKYWCNESNIGLFANYNLCINKSQGEFVKLFAQDDLLHEQNLQVGLDIFSQYPSVGLFANKRIWIDELGEDISEFVQVPDCEFCLASNRALSGLEVIRQCLGQMVNFIGEPSNVMIRKSKIVSRFDTSFHHLGDLEFWLQVLRQSDFFYLNKVYSYFRVHDQSRSSVNSQELLMIPDTVRLIKKFEDLLPEFGQTYENLMLKTSRGLAGHIRSMLMTNQISASDFKSNFAEDRYLNVLAKKQDQSGELQERILSDLMAFRELIFYSLKELGTTRDTEAYKKIPVARKISKMEAKLSRLLNSPSWRATKVLREIKARASISKPSLVAQEPNFFDQDKYLEYLNCQVNNVKASRSWKITNPIRKMGLF